MDLGRKFSVHTPWTSSKRLIYVHFTSSVQWVEAYTYIEASEVKI